MKELCPCDLITSQRPQFLIPSHWELEFQHMNLRGGINIQTIVYPMQDVSHINRFFKNLKGYLPKSSFYIRNFLGQISWCFESRKRVEKLSLASTCKGYENMSST